MSLVSDLPADATLMVVPWHDPVVDAVGFDVRSTYVELFWLNVLGPTATWALRRLVTGLDRYPLGYELDLDETAGMLGLAYSAGTSNSFGRALQRCVLFGMSQPVPGGLAVRRRVPPVATRHLARMPERLRAMHAQWQVRTYTTDDLERGRALAETMVAAGDDPEVVERQLLAVGVSPAAAIEATSLALTRGHAPA
ncbi:MAG: hypothetical protein Q7V57_10130 [Actinomycetota bacterium]|nr:hypothetical protein [Actinomycetota bacterium]